MTTTTTMMMMNKKQVWQRKMSARTGGIAPTYYAAPCDGGDDGNDDGDGDGDGDDDDYQDV